MNNLKENVQHINEHSQEYFEKRLEYYKLSLFKKLMKGITAMTHYLITGAIVFLAIIFLSIAAAWFLADHLGSIPLAFVAVGGFYLLLMIAFMTLLKKKLDRFILRESSKEFFD